MKHLAWACNHVDSHAHARGKCKPCYTRDRARGRYKRRLGRYYRSRYAQRIANGLCGLCGKPNANQLSKCDSCGDKQKARWALRQQAA